FFGDCDLIVTYNGKTFDVPVMETRWAFHRMEMPLAGIPHFDMLHPARRLWRRSTSRSEEGCRLTNLERTLLDMRRVGDVPGFEIPERFFRFLRSGDARPLEPVLEHNRLDLVSLAAVTARAAHMAHAGDGACQDGGEALALGRIYERAEAFDRADACYRRAAASKDCEVRGEALGRLAVRRRRERRFAEAAELWREIVALTASVSTRRDGALGELRQVAVEALAIHHEHRDRNLASARELALFALQEGDGRRAEGVRHRIARLDRKIAKSAGGSPELFTS
nr:ribonuclease H-like domain-containing protein [Acidobacteriota bacterium]